MLSEIGRRAMVPHLSKATTSKLLIAMLVIYASETNAMFVNHSTKELNLRLVYYGPPGAGVEPTLRYVYGKTAPEAKSTMTTVGAAAERRTHFAFIPQSLGKIRELTVRFHLHGLDGTTFSDRAIQEMVRGADGFVFVADGRSDQQEANLEAMRRLRAELKKQGVEWATLPLVLQITRHPGVDQLPVPLIAKSLGLDGRNSIEADPSNGSGVFDVVKAGAKELLLAMKAPGALAVSGAIEGDQRILRSYVCATAIRKHLSAFLGDTREDFDPVSLNGYLPQFQMMIFSPTKDRSYFTYATAGFSAFPQPQGDASPRIELMAYAPRRDENLVNVLGSLGARLHRATAKERPWGPYEAVELENEIADMKNFLLVPARESEAFQMFEHRSEHEIFSAVCRTDTTASVYGFFWEGMPMFTDIDYDAEKAKPAIKPVFLRVIPLSPAELAFARKEGGRALFEKLPASRVGLPSTGSIKH
jgi:signal recognition particle receptor subunit beta